jgi:SAM-dependent methyltransferase
MIQINKSFWDDKYKNNETGWDLGVPSPPLVAYCNQIKDKNIKILIPGAGNSYEAEYLIRNGFNHVTICDISSTPIQNIKNRIGVLADKINFINGDYFDLDEQFDLILEQTFFCALNPILREQYASKQLELLSEKGKVVGVLFSSNFTFDGPPFGGTKEEYLELFENKFNVKTLEPCHNSITPRMGNELFFIFEK